MLVFVLMSMVVVVLAVVVAVVVVCVCLCAFVFVRERVLVSLFVCARVCEHACVCVFVLCSSVCWCSCSGSCSAERLEAEFPYQKAQTRTGPVNFPPPFLVTRFSSNKEFLSLTPLPLQGFGIGTDSNRSKVTKFLPS